MALTLERKPRGSSARPDLAFPSNAARLEISGADGRVVPKTASMAMSLRSDSSGFEAV